MQLSTLQSDFFLLLFLAAVLHSFFLIFLLLGKAGKEKELFFLTIALLVVSLMMINYVLYIGQWIRQRPHLLGVVAPFLYLLGPAYYLFIRKSAEQAFRLRWWDALHLIPFMYILLQWIPVYGWPADAKLKVIAQTFQGHRPGFLYVILGNSHLILVFIYTLISWWFLKNRTTSKKQLVPRLKWLLRFAYFLSVFLLADIGIQIAFWFFAWDGTTMELLLVLILAAAIHVLGYAVLGRDRVLPALNIGKYAHSSLHDSIIAQHQKRIMDYLEQQRPWLDAGFSMGDLSEALGIPRHHISQVLNEGLHLSFHDLISHYRVELFKKRLLAGEAEKYSIQGLAINCGFGSKSSFNRAFKKVAGCTPTEWLKSVASY